MKAVMYEEFRGPLSVKRVAVPSPSHHGVVVKVEASGICRSDWHGWLGHDPDIRHLPHVPGHELAGTVEEVGSKVTSWEKGDRVTAPFVNACGICPECSTGNHQVCDSQTQPGFTHWGSFAEYVEIKHADVNLVRIPNDMEFVVAAILGCRLATSFRAVVDQGRTSPGEWVAVHGCGGVGLSAVMIAVAVGARVVAVDIDPDALRLAQKLGAAAIINPRDSEDVVERIHSMTGRGAHVSIDALGSASTFAISVLCLRKRGRHIQVGLLAGDDFQPRVPMEHVIAKELELVGSHGMQAHRYDAMLDMIMSGTIDPRQLIGKAISLEDAPGELVSMSHYGGAGITVIDRF